MHHKTSMRCLNCHLQGITTSTQICPKCNVHLPSLMRDVLLPGTIIHQGAYCIDYALGRGGFGITYQAVHSKLEKKVAIKEYYPQEHALRDTYTGILIVPTAKQDIYQRGLSRFVTEGKILAKINHPNVVRVENYFEERGTAYLVMELIDGYTLREELNRQPNKKLTHSRVEFIISALVDALATVHAQGIYHLDLKPDNVLLTSDNRLVLVDFGASRQGLSTGTTSQAFTLDYAPPEVLAGKDYGAESDIFELGMMLHEMIIGELPPRAIDRIFNDNWNPDLHPLTEPWKNLIISALQIQKHMRPSNVKQWWRHTPTIQQTTSQINCHACNASNPATHKFCQSCGTSLQVAILNSTQQQSENPELQQSDIHPDDWAKTQKKGFFKFLGSLLDDN